MSYAPGAPRRIWALPGISDGAKLTIMHWWGKADHEAQQACRACTVWAPAGTRPDGSRMTPTESLLADLRDSVHPGKADRTIRGYIAELRRAGLASVDGRCVDLADPATAETRQDPAAAVQKPAGENLPASGENPPDTCNIVPASGENPPLQLIPPVPPSTPHDPPTQRASSRAAPRLVDPPPGQVPLIPPDPPPPKAKRAKRRSGLPDELAAAIREWWADTYLPIRAEVFARWRPSAQTHPLTCTDDRAKEICARLTEHTKGEPWERQREILTHVVKCAAQRVDRQRGESVPYGKGTYDTMRNILPDYWLRRSNFTSLAEETLDIGAPPEPAREEVPPWERDYSRLEDWRR